ncbi:phosphomethylpyrimidine kinase [Thermococci archaeon]|nr:MAG: phosphomethylpyrimidine kinase [Thermococci archaeon]
MRTPCLFWAEVVSPSLRAKIAKNLYERGFTQSQIAEKLGITQAMVSKYLAGKYKPLNEKVEAAIEGLAGEISNMIAYGAPEEEVVKYTSRRFFDMIQGELCEEYLKYANLKDPSLCSEIFRGMASKVEILDVLNLALGELLKDERFLNLIPEIRSNFAYALPNPKGVEDVAAIPGRITRVKGKAFALPPEFGASEHMAKILIELSKKASEIRSVINIKFDESIEGALKRAELRFEVIEEKNRDEDRTVKLIGNIFEEHGELDAVVDRGAFGIEPCVYIFGKNPLEVLDKIKTLESCMS